MELITTIREYFLQWILNSGIEQSNAVIAQEIGIFLASIILFLLFDKLLTFFGRIYIKKLTLKTKTKVDDILFENKVFSFFLHTISVYLLILSIDFIFINLEGL